MIIWGISVILLSVLFLAIMALFKGNPVANWLDWYPGQRINQELAKRPPVQTYPYKSDAVGFNTRFSRYELECKEQFGRPLTKDEEQFLCYVRALDRYKELEE